MNQPDTEQAWPDRFAARADARLRSAGLTTTVRRDGALAVVVALVSVALVLAVMTVPEAAGLAAGPGRLLTMLVLVAAQAVVLCVRRVNPVLCLAVVIVLQVALAAAVPVDATVRGPAPIVAAYTCGAWLPAGRALVVTVAAAVLETVAYLGLVALPAVPASGLAAPVLGQLLSALVVYVAAAQVGGYVATRRRYAEVVALRATEAVEAQRARADAAVGAERVRMARELHDIAAHHLAGMVVQAGVVERLIDRDPDAARRAAAEVRAQGRATLQNLRMVVGALRERDPESGEVSDGGAPVPGLDALDRLIDTVDEAELTVQGEGRPLPPVADVSFYRVAQEAVTNARDHAPGAPIRVTVAYLDAATVLEVHNAAPGSPSTRTDVRRGFGLVGMRERADLIGATLDAGPAADGGWRVRLELPRAERD